MSELLDEAYLTWLYSQVGSVKLRAKNRTYWGLARQLYKTKFVWCVPGDDNRAENGRDLRYEFLEEEIEVIHLDPHWMELECSMLEMLIGLARWLSFEADGGEPPSHWFWHLIDNLDIRYSDRDYNRHTEEAIAAACYRINTRSYFPDGRGGLFPLRRAQRDQRRVELWYQLNAYLLEQGL